MTTQTRMISQTDNDQCQISVIDTELAAKLESNKISVVIDLLYIEHQF